MTVRRELLRMADRTASRMRKQRMLGRTVTISVRFADFTELEPLGHDVPTPTDVTEEIYCAGRCSSTTGSALDRARIRRVGVRVEQLVDRHSCLPAATADRPGARLAGGRPCGRCARCGKFGPAAVQRAACLTRDACGDARTRSRLDDQS